MRVGSIRENQHTEKRIAITPEIVKKYISIGFEIFLSENYGSHLGIKDDQFKDMGVKITDPRSSEGMSKVYAPKGYDTDLASIPFFAAIIFPTFKSEALAEPDVTTVLATVVPAEPAINASIMI